jgi:hypothetical protein
MRIFVCAAARREAADLAASCQPPVIGNDQRRRIPRHRLAQDMLALRASVNCIAIRPLFLGKMRRQGRNAQCAARSGLPCSRTAAGRQGECDRNRYRRYRSTELALIALAVCPRGGEPHNRRSPVIFHF